MYLYISNASKFILVESRSCKSSKLIPTFIQAIFITLFDAKTVLANFLLSFDTGYFAW